MAKLPYPKIKPNASISLMVSSGMTINGSETQMSWSGDVVYNEHHKWVQDANGKKVESAGKLFIFHDILPELSELTGTAQVRGKEYIFWGSRFFNPDGTVHHVELWLK